MTTLKNETNLYHLYVYMHAAYAYVYVYVCVDMSV